MESVRPHRIITFSKYDWSDTYRTASFILSHVICSFLFPLDIFASQHSLMLK